MGFNCAFEARAENEAELMDKIAVHAREAHNMNRMDAKTMRAVRSVIKTD
jgi:predicted small metal-binding protein